MLQYNPSHCTPIAIQYVVLQYNSSHCTPIAIQSIGLQYNSSHCTLLQYTLLGCNTILATAHPLQYNLLGYNTILATALSCNTMAQPPTSLLQYNFSPLHHHIAIQFSSHMHSLAIQTKQTTPFSCNIIPIQFFFLALSLAIQLQGCNINFFFHNTIGQ